MIPINVSISRLNREILQIIFSHTIQWYLLILSLYIQMLQIVFPLQRNGTPIPLILPPISVNYVTIHETGSNSSNTMKKFHAKESLKHLSSVS